MEIVMYNFASVVVTIALYEMVLFLMVGYRYKRYVLKEDFSRFLEYSGLDKYAITSYEYAIRDGIENTVREDLSILNKKINLMEKYLDVRLTTILVNKKQEECAYVENTSNSIARGVKK